MAVAARRHSPARDLRLDQGILVPFCHSSEPDGHPLHSGHLRISVQVRNFPTTLCDTMCLGQFLISYHFW